MSTALLSPAIPHGLEAVPPSGVPPIVASHVAAQRVSLYEALLLLQGKVIQDGEAVHYPTHSPAGLEFHLKNQNTNGPGVGPMIYMRLCEAVEAQLRDVCKGAHVLSPDAKAYPAFLKKK